MSSIDERVVSMKFDNAQFEKGAKDTISTLDKLKKGLSLEGAKKGLAGLANAGKNFTLGGISNAVQGIASKFTALGIVGVTALANIANRAVDAGLTLAKSLTLDPIMDGFREYELKMGSIQTILANTARHGTTLDDVTASLDELNEYADKTIYNFGDMTRNIGLFTNAGIDVGPATSMIKGFSNAAAASGTNAQGAAGAAYQLSQAMSAGTIRLMDWRSLTNVGMGNKNMQIGITEIADAMGELDKAGISSEEVMSDFNSSLEKKWLSADVMSNYLQIMAGDMDAAAMSALGLSDAQIESFQKQQKTAEEAATKVRTFTQLIDTLQEAVGSSWAETFDILFGDFNEATELFTNVSETLDGIIGSFGEERNKLLTGWDELGGRSKLIEALSNAFKALMAILKPIGEAFREIFPPATAETLMSMTTAFAEFTENLIIGEETAGLIKRTFAGFFAILGIGWEVVKGLFGLLLDLFGIVQGGSGGFLEITANIGDFLVALHKAIKEGDGVAKVFRIIGDVVAVIAGVLGAAVGTVVSFGKALAGLFTGKGFQLDLDFNPLQLILDKIIERFKRFGPVIEGAVGLAKDFASVVEQVWGILTRGDFTGGFLSEDSPVVDMLFTIREHLETFWGWIKDFFSNLEFSDLTDILNTGLFAGLLFIFKGGIEDIKGLFGGGEGGFFDSLTGIFDGLTGSLEAMQTSLKADTLIKIAGAIAILAAAVLVLSLIDSDDLTKSLIAISTMFTQLGIAMKVFEGIASGPGIVKMPILAAAMILLAVAVNILALAVKQMSGLSWEELAKGLLGVAGALGLLAAWAKVMEKQQGSLLRAATAMIIVGAGVKILASAVRDFSGMSWEELLTGLAGLGGVLLAVAGFGKIGGGGTLKGAASMLIVGAALHVLMGPLKTLGDMDTDTLIQGLIGLAGVLLVMAAGLSAMTGAIAGAASMVIVAGAMWVLVPLLVTMGEMSWNEIAKAATMLAGALLIIAGGMYLMTGIIAGAASMLVAVAALWVLIPLLVTMGEMSWEEIGKAATMLAGSLLIIAGGMYLMTGALPGAAALLVVSAALSVLTPVLMALSTLSWGELLIGLAALAGVFVVLGLAGLVLAPVIPSLLLLGAAVLLLGAGAALAGVGMLAFALGFTALGAAVAINGLIIVNFVKQLIGLIPYAAEQLGLGIVAVAQVIINAYPVWVNAMVTVLSALISAINTMAPQIINTLWNLIMLMADTLAANVPVLVQKGLELLLGILRGIRDNIRQIVSVALEIITNFINGISDGLPGIVEAGYNLIITFVESLADTIRNNQSRMDAAGRDLAGAIIDGMTSGIRNGASAIANAAKDAAKGALDAAKKFLGIKSPSRAFMSVGKFADQGFAVGLTRHAGQVEEASKDVGKTAVDSLKKSMSGLSAIVNDEMDSDPVIRPVLDLSAVRKDAGSINSLMGKTTIDADVTRNQTEGIASMRRAENTFGDDVSKDSKPTQPLTFYQYNSSPKAISAIETYRNTKNLLSASKGALG